MHEDSDDSDYIVELVLAEMQAELQAVVHRHAGDLPRRECSRVMALLADWLKGWDEREAARIGALVDATYRRLRRDPPPPTQ